MRTEQAVTGAGPIPWGYAALVIVYVSVAGGVVWILRRLANSEVTA
jgi:cytochrome d ubiquinol oxidase subunit I